MGWYNSAWRYRVKVTALASKVDADLVAFPVYQDLSLLPSGFHSHVNQTDARDIRVTTSDGTTEIPREVVAYGSSTDVGELYFKADIANNTNTDFYIYYGNASASDYLETDTYGAQNVWNANFKGVYHFKTKNDSTSNNRDLVGGTLATDSKIGGDSMQLNGNEEATFTSLLLTTITFYVKPTGSIDNKTLFRSNVPDNTIQTVDAVGTWAMWDGDSFDATINGKLIASAYHKYTFAYDGASNYKYSKDGVYVEDHQSISQISLDRFGRAGSIGLPGYYDEVRISTITDPAWESTEFNNLDSNSTFFSIGIEESNFKVGSMLTMFQ